MRYAYTYFATGKGWKRVTQLVPRREGLEIRRGPCDGSPKVTNIALVKCINASPWAQLMDEHERLIEEGYRYIESRPIGMRNLPIYDESVTPGDIGRDMSFFGFTLDPKAVARETIVAAAREAADILAQQGHCELSDVDPTMLTMSTSHWGVWTFSPISETEARSLPLYPLEPALVILALARRYPQAVRVIDMLDPESPMVAPGEIPDDWFFPHSLMEDVGAKSKPLYRELEKSSTETIGFVW